MKTNGGSNPCAVKNNSEQQQHKQQQQTKQKSEIEGKNGATKPYD